MKDWLYFLTDESGKSYTVKNGIVKTVASPTPLTFTPDGWQDLAIGYERNLQKIGTLRSFSLPLGFVMDGAAILRHLFYKKNMEEKVYLLIQRFEMEVTGTDYAPLYKYFYKGELDLSTLKDSDTKVTVNIMEGGLSKLVKANEGTTYEFPLDDPECIRVKMDGIYLYQSINFLVQSGNGSGKHLIGLLEIGKDGTASGVASFSIYSETFTESFATSQKYFLTTPAPIGAINIKGRLKGTRSGLFGSGTFSIRTSTGQTHLLGNFSGASFDIPFDVTFSTVAGENLFLYCDAVNASASNYEEFAFTVAYKSKYRDTFVKAYQPETLYRKLTKKISGKEADAVSDLLTANNHYGITSGDGIRSLVDSKVKTSLNQFFDAFRTILGAGIGIESGKLRLEEYGHFLDESNPVHLGKAKSLDVTRATELIGNTLKIGYETKQIDDVNGKYEFNNTHLYASPITRVVKELSFVSPYCAQPYTIELTRINLEGKTTTDSSKDNEVFILNIDLDNPQVDADGTYYNLKRDFLLTVEGVPDPITIFNVLDLTPKRLLLKQAEWLSSAFYGFEGEKLTFQTTEKNADVKTFLGNEVITEKANYTIGPDKIFIPFFFDFDTEVPVDLVALLEASPNRCFSFEWLGNLFTGFLVKAGIAPNTNKEQAYKLLASPSTDLTKLL